MSDPQAQPRPLSEIGHLFLSSVRGRQTGGARRPQRKPPARAAQPAQPEPAAGDELTPVEVEKVLADAAEQQARPAPPVRAVVLPGGGGHFLAAARQYASAQAAGGKRLGLLALDAGEVHLFSYEPSEEKPEAAEAPQPGAFDARAMRDAVNEMNWDLDGWLVAVGNVRAPEARKLLRQVPRWVALCRCDHDSMVACYRMLKGLTDLPRARLAVASVDCDDPVEAQGLFQRLSNVSRQFLDWPMTWEVENSAGRHAVECAVLSCQLSHDKAQLAAGAHWQIAAELVEQAANTAAEAALQADVEPAGAGGAEEKAGVASPAVEPERSMEPEKAVIKQESPAKIPQAILPASESGAASDVAEVIELSDAGGDEAVLSAVLKHAMQDLVECPVRAPMCPEARLAVGRDRRMVLVAMGGRGLRELRAIGQAYRWLIENRALLTMAMPQFALDAHQHPYLRLLVEQSDVDAAALQPMFQVSTVQVQAYRRVRWGERTGLLLEAA